MTSGLLGRCALVRYSSGTVIVGIEDIHEGGTEGRSRLYRHKGGVKVLDGVLKGVGLCLLDYLFEFF